MTSQKSDMPAVLIAAVLAVAGFGVYVLLVVIHR